MGLDDCHELFAECDSTSQGAGFGCRCINGYQGNGTDCCEFIMLMKITFLKYEYNFAPTLANHLSVQITSDEY